MVQGWVLVPQEQQEAQPVLAGAVQPVQVIMVPVEPGLEEALGLEPVLVELEVVAEVSVSAGVVVEPALEQAAAQAQVLAGRVGALVPVSGVARPG